MTPTALIAVDSNLKVPKSFSFTSNAKPSLFKYPEMLKKEEKKTKEKVETVSLSTTTKVKARQDRNKKDGDVTMADESAPKKDEEMADANKEEVKEGEKSEE